MTDNVTAALMESWTNAQKNSIRMRISQKVSKPDSVPFRTRSMKAAMPRTDPQQAQETKVVVESIINPKSHLVGRDKGQLRS